MFTEGRAPKVLIVKQLVDSTLTKNSLKNKTDLKTKQNKETLTDISWKVPGKSCLDLPTFLCPCHFLQPACGLESDWAFLPSELIVSHVLSLFFLPQVNRKVLGTPLKSEAL